MRAVTQPSHRGQDGLRHPKDAKEVGVELLLGFRKARLLQSAQQRVSRVVDQRVDFACAQQQRPHGLRHAFIVRHIQVNQFDSSKACG